MILCNIFIRFIVLKKQIKAVVPIKNYSFFRQILIFMIIIN